MLNITWKTFTELPSARRLLIFSSFFFFFLSSKIKLRLLLWHMKQVEHFFFVFVWHERLLHLWTLRYVSFGVLPLPLVLHKYWQQVNFFPCFANDNILCFSISFVYLCLTWFSLHTERSIQYSDLNTASKANCLHTLHRKKKLPYVIVRRCLQMSLNIEFTLKRADTNRDLTLALSLDWRKMGGRKLRLFFV